MITVRVDNPTKRIDHAFGADLQVVDHRQFGVVPERQDADTSTADIETVSDVEPAAGTFDVHIAGGARSQANVAGVGIYGSTRQDRQLGRCVSPTVSWPVSDRLLPLPTTDTMPELPARAPASI